MQVSKNQKGKCVIIRTDGGICSQIMFCALGKHFEDLGYIVKYDTSWFKDCGMSVDGNDVRNYDIPRRSLLYILKVLQEKNFLQ